ncbi:hypothetical protein [Streptomyces sp. NPDC058620]|uniref:hypothetical protein n=1 Tax=Streptomyces sp. NPDC058620 TaxID=3346560 RepID=UPI0036477925
MRNESQRQPQAPDTPELAALLAAARRAEAPGADDELRATAAFLAARDAGAHAVRSPWWRRRDDWRPVGRWRGAGSVRVMLGGFVVAAMLGGVAVAAGTGALPTPFGDREKSAPDPVRPAHGTPTPTGEHRSGESRPTPDGSVTAKAAPTGPGSPQPSGGTDRARDEAALCRVYAKVRDRGKAADATAFRRLEAAAGDASDAAVTAYCEALLGRPAPGSKGARDHPDGKGAKKDGPVPPRGTDGGASAGAVGGGRNGAASGSKDGPAAG